MKRTMIAVVMMFSVGGAYAVDFSDLAVNEAGLKAVTAEVAVPAGVEKVVSSVNSFQTPIDGWLDGSNHDHEALDPRGSGSKYVLYATLVKAEGTLYLQAFDPSRGKLSYLADFRTSPEFALGDLAALRSDQGNPYTVAFETYSTAVAKTNMLVVEFNSKRMLRFAIIQYFPTSEIRDGKFKPYVPSDADDRAWSPWIEVR